MIGLGSMGSAMAIALLRRGHKVTVWNRNPERAHTLAAEGASVAASAADAVAASQLVIMCVIDYAAANEILSATSVASALSGRTLVQLSTGSPEQVTAQQTAIVDHGGKFIAGGIMAYPRSIGRPNCMILYAGDRIYGTYQKTLACLAGSSQYLGEDPTAATGAYFALSTYMIGALALFFETAGVCRQYGIPIDMYYLLARLTTDEILEGIRDGAHRIATGNYDGKLASIDLTIAGMDEVRKTFAATGMPVKMLEGLVDALKIASANGAGDSDISRLTETVWAQRHAAPA
jgi:3-hydroxyisobutyrate dehydrogenase-like beta-hydroxyacid dehydrogenase